MLCGHLVVLACTCLVLTGADSSSKLVSPCDQNLISSIKQFWEANGSTRNVLNRIVANKQSTLAATTYKHLANSSHCVNLDPSNGEFKFTFTNQQGATLYEYEQSAKHAGQGILHLTLSHRQKSHQFAWYQIYLDNEINVHYVCDKRRKYEVSPPLFAIYETTQTEIPQNVKDILNEWGVKFSYVSPASCFSKGNELLPSPRPLLGRAVL